MEPLGLSVIRKRKKKQMQLFITLMAVINVATIIYMLLPALGVSFHGFNRFQFHKRDKKRRRLENLNTLIRESDVACKNELRMNRQTFFALCEMVRDIGGLTGTRNMPLEEIVAMFLFTLAHRRKNRSVADYFLRSGESVSRQFNLCLLSILRLHHHLLKKPTPILEDCEDDRWKCFKNCLGALDGTFVSVHVKSDDKPRYRTRNGDLAMNVLGVCTPNMEFIFIMPGWEGSAHDDRVLRDAISRPNGLNVPQGGYYLVDAGYTNCEGFLAPYKGHRYQLKEWGDQQPVTAEEYFNMKHSKARNVIERCFALLKGRWTILKGPSFFPIRTQGRIITACALLHNLIRKHMPTDYVDDLGDEEESHDNSDEEVEYITQVEVSNEWTTFRNNLAQTLFDEWTASSS